MAKRIKTLVAIFCFIAFMGLIKGYFGVDLAKWFWTIYFFLIGLIIFIGLLLAIKDFFKK